MAINHNEVTNGCLFIQYATFYIFEYFWCQVVNVARDEVCFKNLSNDVTGTSVWRTTSLFSLQWYLEHRYYIDCLTSHSLS